MAYEVKAARENALRLHRLYEASVPSFKNSYHATKELATAEAKRRSAGLGQQWIITKLEP